jgi:HEAT repeat protein
MEEFMAIGSLEEAMRILDSQSQSIARREQAAHYLKENPSEAAISRLADAMDDEDFGVRWAASSALAEMGIDGLPYVLRKLIKHYSSPLRESAYHFLHYNNSRWVQEHAAPLMKALKSVAPEVEGPREAYRLLDIYEQEGKQL